MSREELFTKSEYNNYTYEDYMCGQPMRDGEEIRNFLDEMGNAESEDKE